MEPTIDAAQAMTACTHNMSFISLFFQASLTVKFVIVLLIACSVWSWAIIFSKFSLFGTLKKQAIKFEEIFWNSGSIDFLYDKINKGSNDPMILVFLAGMKEWKNGSAKLKIPGLGISLKDRIHRIMHVEINREIDKIEKHLGFLATVGSTAPFVGLFGTVWGIMGVIANESNMNLTAIAPGIAEALFATALGLVVTIPAVIAYNKISLEINRYQNKLEGFVDEFYAIISRCIDDSGI